ncbi:hypothetical protein E2562_032808 [Oryza meyeriana var. granulata]|uniref:Uncharacterized protein n=1 Tax=Oryza meyeriana var. granulata TaxID=110450 RepID=A0A6G1DRP8_9ORYZ|nr:hypothetical protein E2562_032808 [Oryza meyeriana var. granulata]
MAASPPPPVVTSPYARFWATVALASGVVGILFLIARYCPPDRTIVVKLQVALRGVPTAKSLQKDLNKIAKKTGDSNRSWYKFILTESSDISEHLTILVAADGILDFPKVIRSVADLESALAKLHYTPETDHRGVNVLWAPQDEDDILSAERIQKDYPYQKPLIRL